MTMDETHTVDLKLLAKPFTDADIEWRIQGKPRKDDTILVLPYVTNRAIMDRLDAVVGPINWQNMFTTGPGGGVLCGISIRIGTEWITKWDGAENTAVEAVKGGLSDSMKRAAVQWGMGRHLYSLPKFYVKKRNNGERYTPGFGAWNPPRLDSGRRLTEAKPEVNGGSGDIGNRVNAAIEYFGERGIFSGELESAVGKAPKDWTLDDLKALNERYSSL